MTTYRELVNALRMVAPDRSRPVIVHASLPALGEIAGGVETVVGALLTTYDTVVTPVFTYRTMLVPEVGPPDNGITYGSGTQANALAEFFHPNLPADDSLGAFSEALRRLPQAHRSTHPILSFAGVNADPILQAQTIEDPLAPLRALTERGGFVLLMGVDHTRDVSIHLAERLAGRKQFIRWALTRRGVVECPNFPGCSRGFEAITPHLAGTARWVQLGADKIQALPLRELVQVARRMIEANPLALGCDQGDCECCRAIRKQAGM